MWIIDDFFELFLVWILDNLWIDFLPNLIINNKDWVFNAFKMWKQILDSIAFEKVRYVLLLLLLLLLFKYIKLIKLLKRDTGNSFNFSCFF